MEYDMSLALNSADRYVKFIPVFSNTLGSKGCKNIIHVPHGSVYIGK
jgi:hypothetical protein